MKYIKHPKPATLGKISASKPKKPKTTISSPMLGDCYETIRTVSIDSSNQVFYVQTPTGGGNASLDDALALRAAGMALAIAGPDPNAPQPGTPPLGNVGEPLKFTFFIYDHLGNSRILYANTFEDCAPEGVRYLLEHVLDYYPYGKTLREYVHNRERFQTTYHERDAESGLDHRGARNYDGDVCRFLSVDPLATDFASWSTYHYTFNNPILYIDPDGRSGENVNNEYIRDIRTGTVTQVGTAGGDEVDIVMNGTANGDGSFTVTSTEVMDVAHTESGVGPFTETTREPGMRHVHHFYTGTGNADVAFSPVDGAVFAATRVPALVVKGFKALTSAKEPKRGAANPKVADAIAKGRKAHEDFSKRASDKGWQVEPRLTPQNRKDGKTGCGNAKWASRGTETKHPVRASARNEATSQVRKSYWQKRTCDIL